MGQTEKPPVIIVWKRLREGLGPSYRSKHIYEVELEVGEMPTKKAHIFWTKEVTGCWLCGKEEE